MYQAPNQSQGPIRAWTWPGRQQRRQPASHRELHPDQNGRCIPAGYARHAGMRELPSEYIRGMSRAPSGNKIFQIYLQLSSSPDVRRPAILPGDG